jgi:hypothetical protein
MTVLPGTHLVKWKNTTIRFKAWNVCSFEVSATCHSINKTQSHVLDMIWTAQE